MYLCSLFGQQQKTPRKKNIWVAVSGVERDIDCEGCVTTKKKKKKGARVIAGKLRAVPVII
jgi:hypothetical protein